ncbi:MAG TPA: polysaccharide deacetylase family protein [Thermoanaerobaculia bacterium]|nr:polysaccharide deacetylase family protein [Thermoanaerobaculia bacterium]
MVPVELVTSSWQERDAAAAERPRVDPVSGPFGYALTIDVEEWYHTCQVPGYVRPECRPVLADELDHLLPDLLERLALAGRRATFFVLGEVAERLPRRVREIAQAGHEVASHGHLHLRASDRSPREFVRDVRRAKALLEELVGQPVVGYRAPEWSLRNLGNRRLPLVAEAGYLYDSSLAPYPLAGRPDNPRTVSRLRWPRWELLEFPPLSLGGPLRLPAGSWTGRLCRPSWVARAAAAHHAKGGLPVLVVHPWELTGCATPGRLTGLARFVHETGRLRYAPRFEELLAALPWTTLRTAAALQLGSSTAGNTPARPRVARERRAG